MEESDEIEKIISFRVNTKDSQPEIDAISTKEPDRNATDLESSILYETKLLNISELEPVSDNQHPIHRSMSNIRAQTFEQITNPINTMNTLEVSTIIEIEKNDEKPIASNEKEIEKTQPLEHDNLPSKNEEDNEILHPIHRSMSNIRAQEQITTIDNPINNVKTLDLPIMPPIKIKKSISLSSSKNKQVTYNLSNNKNPINLTWTDLYVKMPAKKWCGCCVKKDKVKDNDEEFDYNQKQKDLADTASKKRANIINNVAGYAKSGDVLAIMGASGAGKTTLLNALTFRNKGNFVIEGNIKINGKSIKSFEDIASVSGYVQQDDLYFGYLTVREHLVFQAMLRMKEGTSKKDRLARVDEVIQELNLCKCQANTIGLFGRKGISGGEKRRLAFASEIITDPGILFCDEPTSGLDSYMAYSIMETITALAKKGKTIICTIHQPSSAIFESFDKLCLMVEGKVAYFGQTSDAKDFFASQGLRVPPNYNPADYYIQNLAIMPNEKEKSMETIKKILNGYDASLTKTKKLETIEDINSDYDDYNRFSTKNNSTYKTNVFTQLRWLIWRNMMAIIREPFSFQIQIIQAIFISILFGLIYFDLSYNSSGIQNINGYIFLCVTNNGFSTMFFVVAAFPRDLPLFLREHRNGMYRVITYYLSKIIIDLPTFTLVPIIFMSIAYWMANLNNNFDRFVIAVVIVILVVQCSLAFGTFLSAIAPSVEVALAFAGPVLVPLMVFSGFLLNFDDIPNYFIWLRYFSWFSYANENLLVNQWEGVGNMTRLDCVRTPFDACVFTGNDVLKQSGWKVANKLFNNVLLISLIFFYRIITYVALVLRAYLNSG